MDRTLTYVFGIPGAGKSAVVSGAIDSFGWERLLQQRPFAHLLLISYGPAREVTEAGRIFYRRPTTIEAVYLGRQRAEFPGTDTLAMNVQPKLYPWLAHPPCGTIIGEGDRLANRKFLSIAKGLGYHLNLVWIDTPDAVAAPRRAHRNQDPTWIKGRITKVANLSPLATHRLDGTQPLPVLVSALAGIIRP